MIAAQLIAAHNAAMESYRRAMIYYVVHNSMDGRELVERHGLHE